MLLCQLLFLRRSGDIHADLFLPALFTRSFKLNLRDFLLLFCEAVVGVLMSCVLLVPTILAVVQNPRVDNPPNGWSALLYGWNQRYIHILECFFFPPDIPARPNFTPDSEAKWASLGAWLPLFSMTGVLGFLHRRGRHWLKRSCRSCSSWRSCRS